MTFIKYVLEHGSNEVVKHVKRRCFPNTDSYRDINKYLNGTYYGKFLNDSLIDEFVSLIDNWEAIRDGENYANE
jgi:hypothetical protein